MFLFKYFHYVIFYFVAKIVAIWCPYIKKINFMGNWLGYIMFNYKTTGINNLLPLLTDQVLKT